MNTRICKKCPNNNGSWQWYRKPVIVHGDVRILCTFYRGDANKPCFTVYQEDMKSYPDKNLEKWVKGNIGVEMLKTHCVCYCEHLMGELNR